MKFSFLVTPTSRQNALTAAGESSPASADQRFVGIAARAGRPSLSTFPVSTSFVSFLFDEYHMGHVQPRHLEDLGSI